MTQENSDSGDQDGSNGSGESEKDSGSDSAGQENKDAETSDKSIVDRLIELLNSLLDLLKL
jgi:hypothetical protein